MSVTACGWALYAQRAPERGHPIVQSDQAAPFPVGAAHSVVADLDDRAGPSTQAAGTTPGPWSV